VLIRRLGRSSSLSSCSPGAVNGLFFPYPSVPRRLAPRSCRPLPTSVHAVDRGHHWPRPNAAPGRQATLAKWGCSSRGGTLAPRSVASHGLRPHTVARPSHHRPLLLQPYSTASCSPNKSVWPTLLLRPSLAPFGGSLLAALQAARAPGGGMRKRGSSLTTAPPVASNGGCPHSHRLGGAPLGGGQAQDNSDDEGRGHRGYPSRHHHGSSALVDHPDCSGFFLAYRSLMTARYHPPLNHVVPSRFVGCRVIHCDLALIR
jgi:hypothetical protein